MGRVHNGICSRSRPQAMEARLAIERAEGRGALLQVLLMEAMEVRLASCKRRRRRRAMTKITPEHLARAAFVYVRQSTADQVHNLESQRRQYGSGRSRPPARVGRRRGDRRRSRPIRRRRARPGFEKLLAAICEGRVGAVCRSRPPGWPATAAIGTRCSSSAAWSDVDR